MGCRAHIFATVGNLLPAQRFSSDFKKTLRASAGVGMAIGMNFGRVELNYNLWQRKQDYDQAVPGFQWGIGAEFL
jgi:outer membrane protein assembly factor BamA